MLKVKDILKDLPNVVLQVPPEVTVLHAIGAMKAKKVGSLLVLEQGVFIGIITERDYAQKVELEGKTAANTLVKEVMTPADDVITVNPETTIEECAIMVYNHHIRHLPVLKGNQIIAVISIRDVAKALNDYHSYLAAEYSNYLTGRT